MSSPLRWGLGAAACAAAALGVLRLAGGQPAAGKPARGEFNRVLYAAVMSNQVASAAEIVEFGPKLVLNSAHCAGIVEDLYDFNRDGGGAGEKAAIIQLGHGNGSLGSGRTSGVIYRNRIEINQTVNDPF